MSEHSTDDTERFVGTGHRRSVFPYPGGKSNLAPWIMDHLPAHECYVEVFGGSASVLVSKEPSAIEVYNDRDGDLVHFFEVFRDQTEELIKYLRRTPYSSDLHKKWGRQFYAGYRPENDVERAARFFYLRFTQFASKYNGISGFRSMKQRSPAKQMAQARENLAAFADRFDPVVIENRDFRSVFSRFDGDSTLFYCDPPYVEEGDALYTHGQFDHEEFVDELLALEGDWLVSYTDVPSRLEEFRISERNVQYSSQNGNDGTHKDATERLVMNFDPAKRASFIDSTHRQETLLSADGGGSR